MAKKKESVFDLMNERLDDVSGLAGDHGDGGRGFWPVDDRDMKPGDPERAIELNCRITAAEFDEQGVEFEEDGEKQHDPTLTLHYQVMDGEHEEKEIKGERFWIPLNAPPPTTEGQMKAREIDNKRLIGFYETITGKENPGKIGQIIQGIIDEVNNQEEGEFVEALVKFSVRCAEGRRRKQSASGEDETTERVVRRYYKEYLKERLDEPSE
jgi:hypothetical protein